MKTQTLTCELAKAVGKTKSYQIDKTVLLNETKNTWRMVDDVWINNEPIAIYQSITKTGLKHYAVLIRTSCPNAYKQHIEKTKK